MAQMWEFADDRQWKAARLGEGWLLQNLNTGKVLYIQGNHNWNPYQKQPPPS